MNLPLLAYKRVPFLDPDGATLVIIGPNWSGAAFKMDLRQNPGDTGTAILSITGATAGSQGISATYDAAYAYVDAQGQPATAPATKVMIQIDEATIEGLDLGTPTDKPLVLHYDLHITPSGEPKRVYCEGTFTIKPGVTI
ncbi:hypothetical protein [Blastomonas natatoria]|uniref:hypothetical protein n=1 Tax=Blastomonas natatoria TaxID=34015 RepID=UPI0011B45639|nr:hypothetical protein [Blastomonas natatoria]